MRGRPCDALRHPRTDRTTGASATAAVALLLGRISRSCDPFWVEDGLGFLAVGLTLVLFLALLTCRGLPAAALSPIVLIGISTKGSIMLSVVIHINLLVPYVLLDNFA